MPYESAYEIFKNPNSTVSECVDAIEDLGTEYGYVLRSVALGSRQDTDAESDLIHIKILITDLKRRVVEAFKQSK